MSSSVFFDILPAELVYAVFVVLCVSVGGLFLGFFVYGYDVDQIDTKLKLRGLSRGPFRRPDVEPLKFRMDGHMESTMAALRQKGMDHEAAPRLLARLEWYHQLNRYLDMLKNTAEAIQKVADGLQVLLNYHQHYRAEVEEDLVNAIFSRVLQDGNLSHLYAKLFKRLRSGDQTEWTQNIVRRLFQLCVDEFNSALPEGQENDVLRRRKCNNVKLMAAIFKREMSGVPDDWITDCAESLVQRLDADANEQSVKELCLFVTTLLIAERGENCDSILPSRQRQLLVCFDALERAIAPPRVNVPPPAPEEPCVETPAPEEPCVETPAPEEPCVETPAPEEPCVENDSESDTECESSTESDSSCGCDNCPDTCQFETEYETESEREHETDMSDTELEPRVELKTVKPTGLIEGILDWIKKNVSRSGKMMEDNILHQKTVPQVDIDQDDVKEEDADEKEVDEETLEEEKAQQCALDLEEVQRRAEMRQKLAAAAENRIEKNRHRHQIHHRRR